MANAKVGNVLYIDTDNTAITGPVRIAAIKYVGAASGTADLKSVSDSGDLMWQHAGNVIAFEDVNIRSNQDIHVNLTNSAVIYVYLES